MFLKSHFSLLFLSLTNQTTKSTLPAKLTSKDFAKGFSYRNEKSFIKARKAVTT